jgi:hypothetical protein
MYKKLIEFHIAGKVSFKYVKTFNMDEYVGELCLQNIWIWIYLHSINPKQVNTFGYRTSQRNTCWYK